MGTWGTGIRDDDVVADVIDEVEELLKARAPIDEATRRVRLRWLGGRDESDDAVLVRIALAEVQWTYGAVAPDLAAQVLADLDSGADLARWRDAEPAAAQARRAVLERFAAKLRVANPRPRALPRRRVRPAPYGVGTCLAVRRPEGAFAAAHVLATDERDAERGRCLIVVLDYLEDVAPSLDAFAARPWHVIRDVRDLMVGFPDSAWYSAPVPRSVRPHLTVVGTLPPPAGEPPFTLRSASWLYLGERPLTDRDLPPYGR